VVALLGRLKPAAAEVVLLRVVHNLRVADVAKITGLSETNTRTIVHRSLRELRAITPEPRATLAAASAG
jgi:DNA-directed RNA polymerase specialized sigma24 family protein